MEKNSNASLVTVSPPLSSSPGSKLGHGVDTGTRNVQEEFPFAAYFVQNYDGPHRYTDSPSTRKHLRFYALFRQATEGPCLDSNGEDSLTDTDLDKRSAWMALKDMSKSDAMNEYIKTLDELVEDWRLWQGFSVARQSNCPNKSPQNKNVVHNNGPESTGSPLNDVSAESVRKIPEIVMEVEKLKSRVSQDTQNIESMQTKMAEFVVNKEFNIRSLDDKLSEIYIMKDNLSKMMDYLREDMRVRTERFEQVHDRCMQLTKDMDTSGTLFSSCNPPTPPSARTTVIVPGLYPTGGAAVQGIRNFMRWVFDRNSKPHAIKFAVPLLVLVLLFNVRRLRRRQ